MKFWNCKNCCFTTDNPTAILYDHIAKGHEISQIESGVEE